jgi:cysteine desulfuration protein SufE
MTDFIYRQLNECLDSEEKYWYLINLGKTSPRLDAQHMVNENLVSGCQSQTWLWKKVEVNTFYYVCDSESFLVKGLGYLATDFYSGLSQEEIELKEPAFISELGLDAFITASRVNGLYSIIQKIRSKN